MNIGKKNSAHNYTVKKCCFHMLVCSGIAGQLFNCKLSADPDSTYVPQSKHTSYAFPQIKTKMKQSCSAAQLMTIFTFSSKSRILARGEKKNKLRGPLHKPQKKKKKAHSTRKLIKNPNVKYQNQCIQSTTKIYLPEHSTSKNHLIKKTSNHFSMAKFNTALSDNV